MIFKQKVFIWILMCRLRMCRSKYRIWRISMRKPDSRKIEWYRSSLYVRSIRTRMKNGLQYCLSTIIQKLNYLVQNLKKMINIEQNMIKKDTEDIKRLQKINRNYVDQYYSRVDNHQSIVDQIKSSLQNKIRIDEKFLYTDNIIEESINNEVLKMNQDMKEKQAQEQSKKVLLFKQARKKN